MDCINSKPGSRLTDSQAGEAVSLSYPPGRHWSAELCFLYILNVQAIDIRVASGVATPKISKRLRWAFEYIKQKFSIESSDASPGGPGGPAEMEVWQAEKDTKVEKEDREKRERRSEGGRRRGVE